MSDALRARLHAAAADGAGLLFLSAHLDDAVLSCGGLMSTLAGELPMAVATVFSAAGAPPHTRAAAVFLRQCGAGDAGTLFEDRRREDADVLDALGIEHRHLGVPDALFRRRQVPAAVAAVGRVVPEVVHRYPTFRMDIAKGRVSRGDRFLVDSLEAEVGGLLDATGAGLVLAPIGIGRHVDHLLTRSLGSRFPARVVYYSDFPYDRWGAVDSGFVTAQKLAPVGWAERVDRKPDLIRGYKTQADALFPTGEIPVAPETYYLPG
jgi:LmbE family N-acetylglucosaminyl deacetylase